MQFLVCVSYCCNKAQIADSTTTVTAMDRDVSAKSENPVHECLFGSYTGGKPRSQVITIPQKACVLQMEKVGGG